MAAPDPYSSFDPIGDEVAAGPGIRFGARLIDSILLALALSVVGAITGLGTALAGGVDTTTIVFNAAWVLIVVAYYAFFESSRGQTIGKMILRLRTVGPDGRNPTMEEAVRRNAWYALGVLPFVGGLAQFAAAAAIGFTIASSPMNIGWHDQFGGGTKVIRVDSAARASGSE